MRKNDELSSARLIKRAKTRLTHAISYLEASGLWTDVLADFKLLRSDNLLLEELCGVKDPFEDIFRQRDDKYAQFKYITLVINIIFDKRPLVTLDLNTWEREDETRRLEEAIKGKSDYCHRWRNGYDSSAEVKMCDDGKYCGWYCREYKGCCNGDNARWRGQTLDSRDNRS